MASSSQQYFVTAIGTDSGKTLVSAILTEALRAVYWKPIQSGLPRDTAQVEALVSNGISSFLPEQYVLTQPLSPHAAAMIDGVTIDIRTISLPTTQALVVEGAGGILVPLNQKDFVIDLATQLQIPVIVVANLYLGSINHTLLTLRELQRREEAGLLKVKGLVFNGQAQAASEDIILAHSPYPLLFRVAHETTITKAVVQKYAAVAAAALATRTI